MQFLKSVSPLLVLAAAAVAGHWSSNDPRTRLISELQLAPIQVTLMQACETSFRAFGRAFDPAIGLSRGCGCFAGQVARTSPSTDFTATAAALHALVSLQSEPRGPDNVRELRISSTHGAVDRGAAMRQIGPSIAAMTHCSDPLNHLGDAARTEFRRRMNESARG